ncbi:MAG: hypothetical protein LQ351_001114 [Letrouitia transgressa]|nr:MAG: hypothetical protein LQ351_001114 [Letrouitia transgressa]
MDSLIINPVNRNIVQAVIHAQSYPFQVDQAHNKGEGNETREKIWHGFFKRLHEDAEKMPGARKVEVGSYAQNYVLHDQEVRNLHWNGREIRNALQTAISLAS